MNALMLQAELAQVRKQLSAIMGERETYVRITCLLAKAIATKATVPMIDGNVCVKKSAFEAVPKAYRVDCKMAKAKDENDADPNGIEEDFIVILVSDAPEKSLLVRANGKV